MRPLFRWLREYAAPLIQLGQSGTVLKASVTKGTEARRDELARPYRVRYANEPPTPSDRLLACVAHGPCVDIAEALKGDPRMIRVDLPLLAGPKFEIWESTSPVQTGFHQDIVFAHNERVLLGQVRLSAAALRDTENSVFNTYALIDELLKKTQFPHWLRVWNYLGDLHKGSGDQERYRQFVAGRYKALSLQNNFEHHLPAATAIGTAGDELLIYFLAGRSAGWQIENPRQVSAFRYPRQYGPRSPSFSRAMLIPWQDGAELMVSGTASVVGHETLHPGNPAAQLSESMTNMQVILRGAAERINLREQDWIPQIGKLYVRSSADADAAMSDLSQLVSPSKLVVMQGDICRSDLSLEFEATLTASC